MKVRDVFMYALGALFTIGFFLILGLAIFKEMPEKNSAVLNILLGVLASGIATILGYFYGSSKGSEDKNELLYKSKPAEEPPQK